METRIVPPAEASSRQTPMGDVFDSTLFLALDALQERKIPYAMIGGVAASGMGRPRSTHDIDIFVRPEDAEASIQALESKSFEIEKTDPRWLFKGWKDGMMVDVIFKSQGDIYFDEEMQERSHLILYHGRKIPAVSAEDLIIIKCAVHSEVGPHHWHDALALLSHAQLDWEYLLKRARRAPRRLLALLIYAQSNDIWIPNHIITYLFTTIFDKNDSTGHRRNTSPAVETDKIPEIYLLGRIKEALATNIKTAALDTEIEISDRRILIKGIATSHHQKWSIEEVIRRLSHGYEIKNDVIVSELNPPHEAESFQ